MRVSDYASFAAPACCSDGSRPDVPGSGKLGNDATVEHPVDAQGEGRTPGERSRSFGLSIRA